MIEKHNQDTILSQILELLNSACEACLGLQHFSEADAIERLAEELRAVIQTVRTAKMPLTERLEHAYTDEILDNIEDTLDDICRSAQVSNYARIAQKVELQLYPFFRQLMSSFYFWGGVYPDTTRMKEYYAAEFAQHHQNQYGFTKDCPYKLSIIVPAYNHLDATKRCVEQLLKETDLEKLNAELILMDHGSTDGTLEYFESLGVGKVVHFKRNVRMYMFVTMAQICQGEYFAFVSNDVLVTKNWAEILLACLSSDPRIIAAVPATPNITNYQKLDVPTFDPDEFLLWASKQNQSDPLRWDDRARLMPPIAMYCTKTVSEIGFADPYFYSMEFWDDDFSLRAKRKGYRQLVCGDVACYHFGSITGASAQAKEGTLVYGRQLFLYKNGVDAWGDGVCYDYHAVNLLGEAADAGDVCILGIDCGLGDTMLQIRNVLRHRHQRCMLSSITCQKEYIADLAAISDEFKYSGNLADDLNHSFAGKEFELVYLGRNIEEYPDYIALLNSIQARLRKGGSVLFTCGNPYFLVNLNMLMHFRFPKDAERINFVDPLSIKRIAENNFTSSQILNLTKDIAAVDDFVDRYFSDAMDLQQIKDDLCTEKFYFLCRK